MADKINIKSSAMDVEESEHLLPYSKVVIVLDSTATPSEDDGEDVVYQYEAGDDTGDTLEFECPWGTQAMANNILQHLKSNKIMYHPYTVTGGQLPPIAEMGDAVATNGVYGGLYQCDSTFAHLFMSDYSAPQEEQQSHEYEYESPTERTIRRQAANTKAEFKATNLAIEARVTKEGGTVASNSFAWKLLDNSFTLYSNNNAVFTCNKDGITVDGTIKAKSGQIGSGTNYFTISGNHIYNGKSSYNDGNNGVYIGTDGIGLGAGSFYVTNGGSLYCNSGTFSGSISGATGNFNGTVYCDSLVVRNNKYIGGGLIADSAISDAKISDVGGGKVGTGIAGNNINGGSIPKSKANTNFQNDVQEGMDAKDFCSDLSGSSQVVSWIRSQNGSIGNLYATVSAVFNCKTEVGGSSSTVYIKGKACYWKEFTIGDTTKKFLVTDS